MIVTHSGAMISFVVKQNPSMVAINNKSMTANEHFVVLMLYPTIYFLLTVTTDITAYENLELHKSNLEPLLNI